MHFKENYDVSCECSLLSAKVLYAGIMSSVLTTNLDRFGDKFITFI